LATLAPPRAAMAGKKLVTHGGDERSEKVLRENLPQMSNPQKLSGQHSRL
jgi:hypothetical protein